ncbi:MAG: AraC family transcriptional regulator [Lachnospiraceae bacterium]|nr:AraC family transcriptional regulator [Lachnospiraceae bacterium]
MPEGFKLSNKVMEHSMVSLSVYNVGRQHCTPGHQWGPGIRDHYLIHYVSSGSGTYTAGGKPYSLGAGDVFLVRPNTEISYRASDDDPWTYYWVGFAGTDAGTILGATDFSPSCNILKGIAYGDELRDRLVRISNAYGNTFDSTLRMTGELYLALTLFISNSTASAPAVTDDSQQVKRAAAYIDSHYSYPISVEEIASYTGVSRSTLFRQFRRVLGVSPKEYLDSYRIKRASYLLRHTDLTVGSVSVSVGYDNGLYFSKVFKKATGMTPSQYRSMSGVRQE